jgi:hypothetical protein
MFSSDDPIRLTKKDQLLDLLEGRGWVANKKCVDAVGHTFASVMSSLRAEGYQIASRYVRHTLWEYRLDGKGDPPPKRLTPQQRNVASHYEDAWRAAGLSPDQETRFFAEIPQWIVESKPKPTRCSV